MSQSRKLPGAIVSAQSVRKDLKLVGGTEAPFVLFDDAPFFGVINGTGRITLAAQCMTHNHPDGSIRPDHVITAHLSGNLVAMKCLRDTIDKLLLAATRSEGQSN